MPNRAVILVVDDNEDIRESMALLFELWGYRAVEAANGQRALEALERTPPSLIVLDLNMPEMDGYEFRARLRATNHAAVPVIVVSGNHETHADAALEAVAILRKPVAPNTLLQAIRCVLPRERSSMVTG